MVKSFYPTSSNFFLFNFNIHRVTNFENIPYIVMVNAICKTVKLSQLKKLQILQNINNLMFQVIFIFSDLILIKQIIVSSTISGVGGKRFSKNAARENE